MSGIVAEKIILLFLILFLGIWCYKRNIFDKDTSIKLSNFLLQVVNPIVIFVSYQMEYEERLLKNLFFAFGLGVIGFTVQILLTKVLLRGKQGSSTEIERLSVIYPNSGFIGIPLANILFGREGVFYLTGFLTVFYLLFWTHGVILMAGKTTLREMMKNLLSPAIIGVMLGLFCFLLQIMLPNVLVEAMDSVGSMNTPLAMLVAGATLGQTNIRECIKNSRIYYVTLIRLLVLPIVITLLFALLPLDSVLVLTSILAFSCPAGACCTMFAIKYKKNPVYASQIFAATTLLSVVSIPIVTYVATLCGIG